MKNTPFFLNYGFHPRVPSPRGDPAGRKSPAAAEIAALISTGLAEAKRCLAEAQARQKHYADRKRREQTFEVGDEVLLSTAHLHLACDAGKKLRPRWVGPFQVLSQLGPVAYKLDIPPNWKIHPTLHVSLLRKFVRDGRTVPPPPPEIVDGEVEWEVERVLNRREIR